MKTYKKTSDIKVGVVGYGGAFNMGRQHLLEMQAAGMTPVAVTEIDPKRLEVAESDFPGIGKFQTVTDMLKASPVDLVVIITPHNTHATLAIECLRAGRHVVCEKPLAITTAEVDAMIVAAKKAGVMLSTYHNRHWDGWIMQAVDLIKNRKLIGDIVRVECRMGGYGQPGDWWRTSRSISGGVLYDWGVHLLEYGLQLIESPISEVSGYAHEGFWAPKTAWKEDTNEDEGFLVVRFEGSQWLTLRVTQIDSNPKPAFLEITGTKGSLTLDHQTTALHQHLKGKSIVTTMKNPPCEGHRYYKNIAAHLTGRESLVITAEWSRRPIHILDLGAKSAKAGKALKAKYA